MKNLLRIITVLICLSPLQSWGMQQQPIRKRADAIPAGQAAQTFMQQVLTDYEIDPNSCKILAYCDSSDRTSAFAHILTNKIYLNEAFRSFDSFNPNNPADHFKIFICYHEAGHIKDKAALQKDNQSIKKAGDIAFFSTIGLSMICSYLGQRFLPAKYPNASLFQENSIKIGGDSVPLPSFWLIGSCLSVIVLPIFSAKYAINYVDSKSAYAAEIRADTLACEQLLKKEWGTGPINSYLAFLAHLSLGKNKGKSHDHDAIAEYNNIVQILNQHGFEVVKNVNEHSLIIMIKKNNQVVGTPCGRRMGIIGYC